MTEIKTLRQLNYTLSNNRFTSTQMKMILIIEKIRGIKPAVELMVKFINEKNKTVK